MPNYEVVDEEFPPSDPTPAFAQNVGSSSLKLQQIQSVDLAFNRLISLKSSEINLLIWKSTC